MSLLQVEHLFSGYGKQTVLQDVNLSVNDHEMIGILGPNGCGKSTLLKTICNGISYKGLITINNQDIQKLSEKEFAKLCSYVPQRSGLSIDISAIETVLMGFQPHLSFLENPNSKMRKQAEDFLTQIGMEQKINANYLELSEGQKRLCILARSLVTNAAFLLLDEPDASLDFTMRHKIMQIVLDQVKQNGCSALFSLHDANLALSYCDRIYLMKDGKFVDTICPGQQSISEMEQKLSIIYGDIHILTYKNEAGKTAYTIVQK